MQSARKLKGQTGSSTRFNRSHAQQQHQQQPHQRQQQLQQLQIRPAALDANSCAHSAADGMPQGRQSGLRQTDTLPSALHNYRDASGQQSNAAMQPPTAAMQHSDAVHCSNVIHGSCFSNGLHVSESFTVIHGSNVSRDLDAIHGVDGSNRATVPVRAMQQSGKLHSASRAANAAAASASRERLCLQDIVGVPLRAAPNCDKESVGLAIKGDPNRQLQPSKGQPACASQHASKVQKQGKVSKGIARAANSCVSGENQDQPSVQAKHQATSAEIQAMSIQGSCSSSQDAQLAASNTRGPACRSASVRTVAPRQKPIRLK